MGIHSVNLDENAEKVWSKRFGRGSINDRKFSEWVCNKLLELEEEKYDLNTLVQLHEDLEKENERNSERINELKEKIEIAKQIESLKFSITEKEASFLNESKELINMDSSKLYPRMKSYANIFSKEITEKDFFKLMDMAEEKYPFTQGYIGEKVPKDLNTKESSE